LICRERLQQLCLADILAVAIRSGIERTLRVEGTKWTDLLRAICQILPILHTNGHRHPAFFGISAPIGMGNYCW
jgi:hypothetical protein